MQLRWTLALLAAAACGDNTAGPDARIDSRPSDAPPDANPLSTLAGTGLCMDRGCMQINPEVREYEPRFPLWDDTATKRRWIYLPPDTKIDTTDMDHWVFPVGTKIWKEFSRGVRVETRLIMKQLADDLAPNAWFYASYVWNLAQDETRLVTDGIMNANNTAHDVPSRQDCRACHERLRPTRVLGFDAIQLDYAAPLALLDLQDLIAQGLLSAPPPNAAPHFPLPGSGIDRAALGYFHGNCGHCHNPSSDVHDVAPLDLRLRSAMPATVAGTPAYMTSVNVNAAIPYTEAGKTYTKLIIPQMSADSAVIGRMNSMMGIRFMPNVAVESVDPAGQTALVTWINSL
jgi:hypothetical protein